MNDFGPIAWPFMIPIVAIIGGITAGIVTTVMKARIRELEIRERIAMIERGLVPPPEVDPRGFERAMYRAERRQWSAGAGRHRRVGITLLGVGFGLMMLIGVAGNSPQEGFGVGGFLVILGVAFFINSLFELRQEQSPPRANGASTTAAPGSQPSDSMPRG
jgi:hypothetical protein